MIYRVFVKVGSRELIRAGERGRGVSYNSRKADSHVAWYFCLEQEEYLTYGPIIALTTVSEIFMK